MSEKPSSRNSKELTSALPAGAPLPVPANGPPPLSDTRWEAVNWRLLKPHAHRLRRLRKGGRPRHDDRRVFEGLLWLLWMGRGWRSLPRRYGPLSTVHGRALQWARDGTLFRLCRDLLEETPSAERTAWAPRLDGRMADAALGEMRTVFRIFCR